MLFYPKIVKNKELFYFLLLTIHFFVVTLHPLLRDKSMKFNLLIKN